MKRLIKKITRKVLNSFIDTRNRKKMIFAEWTPVETSDPNAIQYVTDVMATGGAVQIQYQDGGVRTIYPYGWNTSKEGNILIMCYKDDGGIRSYRLDRIEKFFFDSSTLQQNEVQLEQNEEQSNNPTLEISDYSDNAIEELPPLPPDNIENQNNIPVELPFDDALQVLNQPEIQLEQEQLNPLNNDSNKDNLNKNDEDYIDDEDQKSAKIIKRLIRKKGV